MGTIIAVVAVLLIHMDRNAVTPMNPSIRLAWTAKGGQCIRKRKEEVEKEEIMLGFSSVGLHGLEFCRQS
jgi:hypothetical protein